MAQIRRVVRKHSHVVGGGSRISARAGAPPAAEAAAPAGDLRPSRAKFGQQVSDLYQHLYDLVYLRTHPLVEILVPDPAIARKDRAWHLQELLLSTIKELDPGPQAAPFSPEWRHHRLMMRRYKSGLVPRAVMQELNISRRQYYRDHQAAMDALAGILWERFLAQRALPPAEEVSASVGGASGSGASQLSHLGMLRLEAARTAQVERYTQPGDVVRAALPLLAERLRQRGIAVSLDLPEPLPGVAIGQGILRQVFLGLLGYLAERASGATLRVAVHPEGETVVLSMAVSPPDALRQTDAAEVNQRLTAFAEMATSGGASLRPCYVAGNVAGFELHMPTEGQRTVLVVDDNEDVQELFRRFLSPHGYRVVTARTAPEALDLATRLQPYAITLDLMLPGQDGWDLLQTLLNRPETRRIPVIICSVLMQKELALSLGATAFLGKPLTEQDLLAALQALAAR